MSQSLSTTFSNLELAPPKRMELALPTHFTTNGRVCFYGYAVTSEWLVEFAKAHWKDAERFDNLAKVSTAIKLLRAQSGIRSLLYESALADKAVPEDTILLPGHRPGELMVPLLAIFSDEKSSYKKRPSQAQVDRLSEIMGGKQPRWWVDYEDPRSYEC